MQQADHEDGEHAELEDAQDDPGRVRCPGTSARNELLNCTTIDARRMAVVVEELLLARVEHQAADHQVHAGDDRPVRDAVRDRPSADDREIRSTGGRPWRPVAMHLLSIAREALRSTF